MSTHVPLGHLRRQRTEQGGLAVAALVLTAFLFGSTFIVMQEAVEDVEPVPFLVVRFTLGALVVMPIAFRRRAASGAAPGLLIAGVGAGVALAIGYVFQTVGLQYTTTSVSAFLTYLLVVFVPLLSALVLRRMPPTTSVAGVALAVVGLVLMTSGDGIGAGRGELLTLGCALAFAVHILVLDRIAPRFDVVRLNTVQFLTVAAVLAVPAIVSGGFDFPVTAWLAAAYTGVAVTALAFGLQVWGQRHVGPTRTALLLLTEPIFAAIIGFAIGERLGAAGAAGVGLIFAGILVSELGSVVVPRPEEP